MNLKIYKGYEQFPDNYPEVPVKYAMTHKEEAIPELLEILEYTINNVESLSKNPEFLIHFPAIYILAYFRETRAYESIIKIASLPDEQIYDLLGDTVTEDLKNIIASVCDGNIEPIKKIIEDASLDEYVRTEALKALLIMLNNGVVSREQLATYFKELLNGRLEEDASCVWDDLPRYCSLIHPAGLEDDIVKAVTDGKVMEIIADLGYVKHQSKRPIEEVLDELKRDENYSFISEDDVYSLQGWVGKAWVEEDDGESLFDWDYEDGTEDDFGDFDMPESLLS